MHEPLDERDDTGGVGEDLVPFSERFVSGENDGTVLIPTGDDLQEQVGIAGVVGEVADFVNTKDSGLSVAPKASRSWSISEAVVKRAVKPRRTAWWVRYFATMVLPSPLGPRNTPLAVSLRNSRLPYHIDFRGDR